MEKERDIDETIVKATELVNKAYENLLRDLFQLGDYTHDLKIEYQDIDGKTISMSWHEREKRTDWLNREE